MPDDASFPIARSLEILQPVSEKDRGRFWADDQFDLRHEFFHHESISRMWSEQGDNSFKAGPLRLFRLSTQEITSLTALTVYGVASNQRADAFRVDLSINESDSSGFWLQFCDGAGNLHGVVLPSDSIRARYIVEFHTINPESDAVEVSRLGVFVSESSDEPLRSACMAWNLLLNGDSESASNLLETTLASRYQQSSPLTSLMTELVMLRVGKKNTIDGRFFESARANPNSPDLTVLLVERLLRGRHDAIHVAAKLLAKSPTKALPHTIEGLSYADALINRLLTAAEIIHEDLVNELRRKVSLISDLTRFLLPDGLFVTLSHYSEEEAPWKMLCPSTQSNQQPLTSSSHAKAFVDVQVAFPFQEIQTVARRALSLWVYIEKQLNEIRNANASDEFPLIFKALGTLILPWFINKGLAASDAEELACETIERIVLGIHRFELRGEGSLKAWCSRLADNVKTDWLRRKMRWKTVFVENDVLDQIAKQEFENESQEGDSDHAVQLAVAQLSDDEREALNMHIEMGLKHAEIGQRLGITADASRQRVKRAKDKLIKQLQPFMSEK